MAKAKKGLDCLLYVGVHVDAVNASKVAIMDIIRHGCTDDVKREALVTLRELCKVSGVTINNSSFAGTTP